MNYIFVLVFFKNDCYDKILFCLFGIIGNDKVIIWYMYFFKCVCIFSL